MSFLSIILLILRYLPTAISIVKEIIALIRQRKGQERKDLTDRFFGIIKRAAEDRFVGAKHAQDLEDFLTELKSTGDSK